MEEGGSTSGVGVNGGYDSEHDRAAVVSQAAPGPSLMDQYNQTTIKLETQRLQAEALLEASKKEYLQLQTGEGADPKRLSGLVQVQQGGIMEGAEKSFPLMLAGIAAYFFLKKRR